MCFLASLSLTTIILLTHELTYFSRQEKLNPKPKYEDFENISNTAAAAKAGQRVNRLIMTDPSLRHKHI